MEKCPDKDCGDNVTRLVFFMRLFGVSLGVIATVVLGTALYGLDASAKDKLHVQDISTKQAVVMDKLDTAVDAQNEIKKTQQDIMLNVQSLQDDVEHEAERSRKVDEVILRKLNEIQNKQ